ncbi:MAG: general secretion pathway protein GspK [Planctomycetes bacterium]|nr:general secretion pathway protein GspK [Planctomycetota bacterium]
MRGARAIILPVVLVLIGLLSLTMAGFIFFVRAEIAGTAAHCDAQQARLAAESGLEEVVAILREHPHDATVWFEAPDRLRHALVWAESYDRESDPVREMGSRQELLEGMVTPVSAWRYSVVAQAYDTVEDTVRYGITPEAGKLNINVATEEQLEQLLMPLLLGLEVENAPELLEALFDWRDDDDQPRPSGAENDYYNTLEPAYLAKNTGRFDTIEELLLIKGFNAAILYGEDVNRNGILDTNEDDGEDSFPYYDNADGVLDRGLAPFLTVWSRETDVALDNKPRINLNADRGVIEAQIATYFQEGELSDETIGFILGLKDDNFNFADLGSPAELYQGIDLPELEDEERVTEGALASSPITAGELPYLLDRFSTRAANESQQVIEGLININTAPAIVLELLPGLDAESAGMLVATRRDLDREALRTPAWALTSSVVGLAAFHQMAPYVTTKAHQFHVEVLGYADHARLSRRTEWIIEMAGPLAQIKYTRDLTSLGMAWPVDDDTIVVTTD